MTYNTDEKFPKPVKKIKSKTSIPFEYFKMTPIEPGDKEYVPLEKIHEDLIKQMTNMDEKEIKNMADIIVGLIKELRESQKSK